MGDGPVRAVLVLGMLLAAWILVRWLTGQAPLAMLALALLMVTLWRFFVPVTFELNAQGVEQSLFRWRRRIPWSAVGSYEVCHGGVLLLPTVQQRPVDVFRGLFLPWDGRREEVLAHVRYHLDPWDVE